MKTKCEIMESVWNAHGPATSVMDLCYELRKQWPNKQGSYKKECLDFLMMKVSKLRDNNKNIKRYDIPLRGNEAPFRELPQLWQSMKDQLTSKLVEAFKGLNYEF